MHFMPGDGKWQVGGNASLLIELRQQMPPDEYQANKQALQEFLCGYFSSGECSNAQGSSISPMTATAKGGKVLKVRWAMPGSGKSGSLRLVVVAYCEERRVYIAQAFRRRDDPTDDDINEALNGL